MARIEIISRDVDHLSTLPDHMTPQHSFYLYTNDAGERFVLRGGQYTDGVGKNNLLDTSSLNHGSLTVILDLYEWDGIDRNSKPIDLESDHAPLHPSTYAMGSDSVISQIWEAMVDEGQNINDHPIAYEYFNTNCNAGLRTIGEAGIGRYGQLQFDAAAEGYSLGVEVFNGLNVLPTDDQGQGYWMPGFDTNLDNIIIDQKLSPDKFSILDNDGNPISIFKGDHGSLLLADSGLIGSDVVYVDENNNPVSSYDALFKLDDNNGNIFTIVKDNVSVALVDGSKALLSDVVQMSIVAEVALQNFVGSYINHITNAFSNDATGLISDVAAGIEQGLTAEQIAKNIAVKIAIHTFADGEINQFVFSQADTSVLESGQGSLSDQGQETLRFMQESNVYKTTYIAALSFTATIILHQGDAFDGSEYSQAALQATAQAAAQTAVANAVSSELIGPALGAGVGAGAATLISAGVADLFADDHLDPGQWRSTTQRAGEMGVAAAVGSYIATALIVGSSVAGPIGAVVAMAIVSQMLGKKHHYEAGEYANSYDFSQVTAKPDGSGNQIIGLEQEGAILIAGNSIDDIIGTMGPDVMIGGNSKNVIVGYAGNDYIEGRGGDDLIIAGAGDDEIHGGLGDDSIYSDEGNNLIFGDEGNDAILAGSGNDYIEGGAGDDQIQAGGGNDYVSGGLGNDIILAGAGDDMVNGDAGDDNIFGEDGNDIIIAGSGNDLVDGGRGNDIIIGDAGNDNLAGGDGNDIIEGNDGIDIIHGDAGDDIINAGKDDDLVFGGIGNDIIYGGEGNDILQGEIGNDYLLGGDGNDTLNGFTGDDLIYGGRGNDLISGGTGNDLIVFLVGDGQDIIDDADHLSQDRDVIYFADISAEQIILTRQNNDLIVNFIDKNKPVVSDQITIKNQFQSEHNLVIEELQFKEGKRIDLNNLNFDVDNQASFASGNYDNINSKIAAGLVLEYQDNFSFDREQYTNIYSAFYQNNYQTVENNQTNDDQFNQVQWYSYKDKDYFFGDYYQVWYKYYQHNLRGDAGNNNIIGNWWSEDISGYGGNDHLVGGDGNDNIDGGIGCDLISGGAGDDHLIGGQGNDRIFGGGGNDYIEGGVDNDDLIGNDGNDTILGGDGDDQIQGNAGNDFLDGGQGNNIIFGGDGDDSITAGDGNNFIAGGAGNDVIDIDNGQGVGSNYIVAGDGNDQINTHNGNNVIFGNDGNDNIVIDLGNNVIFGGEGDDVISVGNSGAGPENSVSSNRVYGGSGDDVLVVNQGNNFLDGGVGSDVFILADNDNNSADIINNFNAKEDKIVLRAQFSTSFSYLQGLMQQNGNNLEINLHHKIIINNITQSDFNESNFIINVNNQDPLLSGPILFSTTINDVLLAGNENNIIYGGAGNDELWASDYSNNIFNGANHLDTGNNLSFDINPRQLADVNGDGNADLITFANSGVEVALGNGDGTFANKFLALNNFASSAFSWSSFNNDPRLMADVNGDGRSDIVAFTHNWIYTALGKPDGTFTDARTVMNYNLDNFDKVPRKIADINGDGRDDVVYFGYFGATYAFLGKPDGGLLVPYIYAAVIANDFGNPVWNSYDRNPRELVDLNHDHKADIIAFADDGVYVAYAGPNNVLNTPTYLNVPYYSPKIKVLSDFGYNQGWTSEELMTRKVVDIDGDGNMDIVGIKADGIYAAFGRSDGSQWGGFSDKIKISNEWSFSSSNSHQEIIDLNRDGKADIVNLTTSGADVALAYQGTTNENNFMFGGSGDDSIHGSNGQDLIFGGKGDDVIYGYSNNDKIIGGLGNDQLQGGLGNDIYIYDLGDGRDVVTEFGRDDRDVIQLGLGIKPQDLNFFTQDHDLIIQIGDNVNDQIIIANQNNFKNEDKIEYIQFSDNVLHPIEDVIQHHGEWLM